MVSTVRTLSGTGLGLVALAVMACATAEEPNNMPNNPTGGQVGVGGSTGGQVGTAGTLPTAGTTPLPMGGSGTGTAGTGTGGMTPTTGGTVGTAGTVGTGGTATGTCPPYAGTLGTTAAADSAIFMAGFGKSTVGMWGGYAYTYKYGTMATVTPGMGTSCFAGKKMCASGTVPMLDTDGAGLGWNIAQMMGSTTMTTAPITTPVVLKFVGVTAGMRVQLSAPAMVSYCYTLTAAEATAGTATIAPASFKKACWDATTAVAYAGEPIEAIQVAVPGGAAAAPTFDFCLLDIEPG
jgi:hypothetical protein